jgi:hypothetical protein
MIIRSRPFTVGFPDELEVGFDVDVDVDVEDEVGVELEFDNSRALVARP